MASMCWRATRNSATSFKLRHIGDGRIHGGLSIEPTVDRPRPWILLSRISHRQWDRNRQRQVRREPWQPALLLFHLQGVRRMARQSYGHLATKMKSPVVPASEFDRRDGMVCPLPKLSSDQPPHKRDVDNHGIGVHVARAVIFVGHGIQIDPTCIRSVSTRPDWPPVLPFPWQDFPSAGRAAGVGRGGGVGNRTCQ